MSPPFPPGLRRSAEHGFNVGGAFVIASVVGGLWLLLGPRWAGAALLFGGLCVGVLLFLSVTSESGGGEA